MTELMKALEETSEALEFALVRLGCCGNGDGKDRKADVDDYGGMELCARNKKLLENIRNNNIPDVTETKAAAYDRLMSMNSTSENDIQIVLDGNAWCAYRLPFRNLQEDDAGFGATPQIALTALLESELPDGWELSKEDV
jgi:hypothetical protein